MHIAILITFLMITLTYALLTLLHNYIKDQNLKKSTSAKVYKRCTFEDMISIEQHGRTKVLNERELDNGVEKWKPDKRDMLYSLDKAFKSALATTTEKPVVVFKKHHNQATDLEVLYSLQAAMAFKSSGNVKKANKLFAHVARLAPENPDVLNWYGEFIEHLHNDIVAADQLYFKALTHSPGHKGALANRRRTAHVVEKLDLRLLKNIDEKCNSLKRTQKTNPIYDHVRRQAYYLHIYHTVAIEGNTMTLEQLRFVLETGKVVGGKSIIEHNEILGLHLAMEYVKILTRFPIIDVEEILGIHRRVLGHVDPVNCGVFRNKRVYIGNHIPPPPEDLQRLIEDYVEWLNSEEAQSMHPVRYSALAHYKLVDIHPFSDGNGRTSRLIMNLILLRGGYPPVMILKHQREKYYEYLNLANKGDVRPFVRFIVHCTDSMLDVYHKSTERFSRGITNLNFTTIKVK